MNWITRLWRRQDTAELDARVEAASKRAREAAMLRAHAEHLGAVTAKHLRENHLSERVLQEWAATYRRGHHA